MDTKSAKSGDLLIKKDSTVDNLWYISEGKVNAVCNNLKLTLKKGDFLGLADFDRGINSFDYIATENTTLINFCSRESLMQSNFFASKIENSRAIALSMNHIVRDAFLYLNSLCSRSETLYKFISEINTSYNQICGGLHVEPVKISLLDELDDPVSMSYSHKCLFQYHKGTYMQLYDKDAAAELIKNLVVPGYMIHAVADLQEVIRSIDYVSMLVDGYNEILINHDNDDILSCFEKLYKSVESDHSLSSKIMDSMISICDNALECPVELRRDRINGVQSSTNSPEDVPQTEILENSITDKVTDSMNRIMDYCDFGEEKAKEFKKVVEEYKNLVDQNSTDDEARAIRKKIEHYFYQLYLSAMEYSLENTECPNLIKMFLNFGYLDEELAGIDNALQLYDLVQTYKGSPESGIYTGYEWLLAIFTRDREPSINEFDQTYEQFITEQKDAGRIPASQYKQYLTDRAQMVMFELQNMFKSASRMCSGRILNFCPILCESQILRTAKEDIVDASMLIAARDAIRSVDYSIFYRESVFVYNKKENIHDYIHVEILPDLILLPVVGSRGAMWQEISGRDRMTAARMMLPVFNVEGLEKPLLRMFAEYRWEMCKRTQGARWNDVTDPSLTSLYYDYLQFYRKNSAISIEQKEKIKIGLQRARNVYKEFFINDYADYIKYESNGSPHLIRASRVILYEQCPFSAKIRAQLGTNPMFGELNDKLKIKYAQRIHKLDNIQKKLTSKGYDVPKQLSLEMNYYIM